jgi:hypothetical protein
VPKRTSTRARRKPADQEALARILNLLRIGIAAGVGAMIEEIYAGEPHLRVDDALQ